MRMLYTCWRFISAVASVFCIFQMDAYVFGYTRMYRPESHTTLDIVYDRHEPTSLSHADLQLNLCDDIKRGLYPTERVLVESLEHLNQTHQGETSVIWEHTRNPNIVSVHIHLLSSPQRLIWNRLKNVHLIAADEWRNDYPRCIHSLLNGGSLHQRIDRQAIIRHSGVRVWEEYQQFMHDTTRRLVNAYGTYKDKVASSHFGDDTYQKIVKEQLVPYTELADVEMLSHILASPNQRIVLFAGGAHCQRIVEFLIAHTTFQGVHSVIDANLNEIPAYELELVAKDHITNRQPRLASQQKRSPQVSVDTSHRKNPAMPPLKPGQRQKASSKKGDADSLHKDLMIGGALLLAWVWTTSCNEHKKNPGSDWSSIVKRKLLTGLQYGALPAACAYLLCKESGLTNNSSKV